MMLVRFFLTRPVLAVVCGIFLVLFGAISWHAIPYQLLPHITRPTISIYTYYPGATPQEVEKAVIQKQESALKNLKSLQMLTSTMRDGLGIINLEFALGSDMKNAFVEVSTKLEEITNYPQDVKKPIIKTTGESIPISVYVFVKPKAISAHDYGSSMPDNLAFIDGFREIVANEVLPFYERINGVGEVILQGGVIQQAQIVLNTAKLAFHNITIQDVIHAISTQNQNITATSIDFHQRNYRVQTIGEYQSIQEVLESIIRLQNGKPTRLKDIASVQIGYTKKTSYNRYNGDEVLSLQIRPTATANILDMTNAIEQLTNHLNADVLAKYGIEIEWGHDQRGFILSAIAQVQKSVLLGMCLAILVLLLFLRNLASLLLVALVIPLSIIGTFIVLHVCGRTLNIISLAGISFAISMVIDSAIVVLESIIRHRRKGIHTPLEATYIGVREVIGALLASSITTIAIFVPIVYLQDEAGQLFADIGIAASSAIVIAFLVCVLMIPALLLLFLKMPTSQSFQAPHISNTAPNISPLQMQHHKHSPSQLAQHKRFYFFTYTLHVLTRFYGGMLRTLTSLSHVIGVCGLACNARIMRVVMYCVASGVRRVCVVVIFLGFCIGFSYYTFPKTDYLPRGERNFLSTYVAIPAGLSFSEKRYIVQQITDKIEPFLRKNGYIQHSPNDVPAIESFFISASNSIGFYLIASNPKESAHLMRFARDVVNGIAGISGVTVRQPIFRMASSSSIDINVSGDDFSQIFAATSALEQAIKERFSNIGVRVVPSLATNNREIHLYPNHIALLENKLDVASFGNIVSVLLGGKTLGVVHNHGLDMELILQTSERNHAPEDMLYAPIYTPSGKIVMLGALSHATSAQGVATIRHFEQKRNLLVLVNPMDNTPLEELMSLINSEILPPIARAYPQLNITLNGNADKLTILKQELLGGFVLAVVITYLILCAIYGSFLYPLIIIASVPLAISGGLMGLFFTNAFIAPQNLDVITMLGFIILVGSVVNNAILLIYQARINYQHYGMKWSDSVLDSTRTRLAPIAMSMLTSVLALLPLVIFAGDGGEIYRGLGSVLIGGLMLGAVVSVFIIPCLLLSVRSAQAMDKKA